MFGMDMPRNSWITISKISRILPTRNHDLRLFTYTFNDKIYRYLNWFFLIYRLSCWYLPFFTKTEHKCSRRPVVSLSILLLKNIDLQYIQRFLLNNSKLYRSQLYKRLTFSTFETSSFQFHFRDADFLGNPRSVSQKVSEWRQTGLDFLRIMNYIFLLPIRSNALHTFMMKILL